MAEAGVAEATRSWQCAHERIAAGMSTSAPCDTCLREAVEFVKPHLALFGFPPVDIMALMVTKLGQTGNGEIQGLDRNKRLEIIRSDKKGGIGKDSSIVLLMDCILSSPQSLMDVFMRSLRFRSEAAVHIHDMILVSCVCLSAHRDVILYLRNALDTGRLGSLNGILAALQETGLIPENGTGTNEPGPIGPQVHLESNHQNEACSRPNVAAAGEMRNPRRREERIANEAVGACRAEHHESRGSRLGFHPRPEEEAQRASDPTAAAGEMRNPRRREERIANEAVGACRAEHHESRGSRLGFHPRPEEEAQRASDPTAGVSFLFASLYFHLAERLRHSLGESLDPRDFMAWSNALTQSFDDLPEVKHCLPSSESMARILRDAHDMLRQDPYMERADSGQQVRPDSQGHAVAEDVRVTRATDDGENFSIISSSTDERNNLADYPLLLRDMAPNDLADLENLRIGPITLRPYQQELLRSARKGRNVLIWLDTGAGKTYIVLKYAEEHLKGSDERRLVFVVPKVRLAQQQYVRFVSYLPAFNPHLRCGPTNSAKRPSFSSLISKCRVFVVTAQCLVEAVERGEISLAQFSLMVLDECHHTSGGHPFKRLMNLYMELKFGFPAGSVGLPQIIGLTASPGIGRLRGGKLEEAVKHLYSLTASLDVEEICSVQKHVRDLEDHVTRPKHEVRSYEKRTADRFKKHIQSIMQEVIRAMQTHPAVIQFAELLRVKDKSKAGEFEGSLVPPSFEAMDSFTEWLSSRDKCFLYVVDASARYTIMACIDTLKIYLKALTLHEECLATDALDFLRTEFEPMRSSNPEKANVDMELAELFYAHLQSLETEARESKNPKLDLLEELILLGIKRPLPDGSQETEGATDLTFQSLYPSMAHGVVKLSELNDLSCPATGCNLQLNSSTTDVKQIYNNQDDAEAMSVQTRADDDLPVPSQCEVDDDAATFVNSVDDLDSASMIEDSAENDVVRPEGADDVRGMIFVRTLELTRLIPQWLNRHPKLSWLNPGRITGATSSSSQGGMTKKEVAEVMSNFNRGLHKMLVCTSAAEEGLDFRACNLVIRYDYDSSLVSMIQTRGRARQKDALYGVLANPLKGSINKEEQNISSEVLMRDAVAVFQEKVYRNPEEHCADLARTQFQNYQKRWRKEASDVKKLREKLPEGRYDLRCRKCCFFACSSSDVKRLKSTNHVVIGPAFARRYTKLQPKIDKKKQYDKDLPKTGDLACNRCEEPWGIIAKCISENLEFPIIKIERFCIQNENGERFLVKKWCKAFPVPEFGEEDRLKHKLPFTSETRPLPDKDDNRFQENLNNDIPATVKHSTDKMDFFVDPDRDLGWDSEVIDHMIPRMQFRTETSGIDNDYDEDFECFFDPNDGLDEPDDDFL